MSRPMGGTDADVVRPRQARPSRRFVHGVSWVDLAVLLLPLLSFPCGVLLRVVGAGQLFEGFPRGQQSLPRRPFVEFQGHFKVLFAPRDVSLPKALRQFELCLRVTQFQGRVEQKLERLACIHRKSARAPSIGPGECAVGRSRCEARLDRRLRPRHGIRFANHPSHSREETHRHQIAEFAAPARQRDDFRRQGRFPGLIVRACVGRMHPFQRQFRIRLGTFGLHLPFKVLDPSDDVRLAIDLREHVRVVGMPLELLGEPMVGLANQENQKGKTR